jgi:hypothetical protein
MFVLGSLLHWKTTAAILAVVPLLAMLYLWKVCQNMPHF